jgi:hypothetical protein
MSSQYTALFNQLLIAIISELFSLLYASKKAPLIADTQPTSSINVLTDFG